MTSRNTVQSVTLIGMLCVATGCRLERREDLAVRTGSAVGRLVITAADSVTDTVTDSAENCLPDTVRTLRHGSRIAP